MYMSLASWLTCFIGIWIASTPISEQSFETRETGLEGEDKELLLTFARSVLTWMPEERPTAEEPAYNDFLMQAFFGRRKEQEAQQLD